ncbi:MAG: hypothetical protein LC667_01180 [Thioalkalivibrio sp.]|nr:hypothetical protein [Thioalkalivibrio sp.]
MESAETKTFQLSKRLAVEITVGLGGVCCEWTPSQPRRMTKREVARYREGRDQLLARLAEKTGKRVVVVEL